MRSTTMIFITLVFILQGNVRAADQAPQAGYSLKQDAPDVGSNIKRDIVRNSLVPLDKRYSELTPQEKDRFKSQYEKMGPNDEPPFPVNGLATLYRTIVLGAQKLQAQGQLVLFVEVDPEGNGTSVSVVQSPDPEMTQFAARVLILERYKPAVCDGTPCKMQFPFRINFTKRL